MLNSIMNSLLDKAPNYLVGCVIQKRSIENYTFFSDFRDHVEPIVSPDYSGQPNLQQGYMHCAVCTCRTSRGAGPGIL